MQDALDNLQRATNYKNSSLTNLVAFNPNFGSLANQGAYKPTWFVDSARVQQAQARAALNRASNQWATNFTLTSLDLEDTTPLRSVRSGLAQ